LFLLWSGALLLPNLLRAFPAIASEDPGTLHTPVP
jgi:hypothetical protein